MSLSRPNKLAVLRKRMDFLEHRVVDREFRSEDASYDRQEAAVLRWALDILEPMVAEDDPRTRRPQKNLLTTSDEPGTM